MLAVCADFNYVVLFLPINVLYYVILYYVSCSVWTPGRVAAAFATANEDPNKITNDSIPERYGLHNCALSPKTNDQMTNYSFYGHRVGERIHKRWQL